MTHALLSSMQIVVDGLLPIFVASRHTKNRNDSIKCYGKKVNGKGRQTTQSTEKKIFTQKNILGQNIISCRSFALDSPKTFSFLGSYKSVPDLPIYPLVEIAFVGRSNVGKSSLLNSLTGLNKKIAVEGKTPGRTQSMNVFKCGDKQGDICIFLDLPGYGYAKISKTTQEEISNFIGEYLLERSTLKLVILLVDARRDTQKYDMEMFDFLASNDIPFAVVATKVDKMKKNELEVSLAKLRSAFSLQEHELLPFSAVTGQGVKDVWRAIRTVILEDTTNEEED